MGEGDGHVCSLDPDKPGPPLHLQEDWQMTHGPRITDSVEVEKYNILSQLGCRDSKMS